MPLLEVVFLAIIQGIAEFLPISSSGHVVVAAALFRQFGHTMQQMVTVNVVLHVGTLGAILVFYRHRIGRLIAEDRRLIGLLAVGTLPAVLVAPPLRWYFGGPLESPALAAWMFLVTGAMLAWLVRWLQKGRLHYFAWWVIPLGVALIAWTLLAP